MQSRSCLAAATAALLFAGIPGRTASQQPAAALTSTAATVAPLKGCTTAAFDESNQVLIENRCGYTVQSVWFFGTGNRGALRLAPQQQAPTGVNTTQIPQLGSLRMFTCPVDHPVPQTAGGQPLTAPEREFVCGRKTPHHFDAASPRTFDYPVLTSGDCVLERGRLTFTSNGEVRWSASIHTNHTMSRDIWHLGFNVVDSSGNLLFDVPLSDSPDMRGSPSSAIPWGVIDRFDKTKFTAIDDVIITRTAC